MRLVPIKCCNGYAASHIRLRGSRACPIKKSLSRAGTADFFLFSSNITAMPKEQPRKRNYQTHSRKPNKDKDWRVVGSLEAPPPRPQEFIACPGFYPSSGEPGDIQDLVTLWLPAIKSFLELIVPNSTHSKPYFDAVRLNPTKLLLMLHQLQRPDGAIKMNLNFADIRDLLGMSSGLAKGTISEVRCRLLVVRFFVVLTNCLC